MENKFYRILFFLSILLIIISFDLAHNPPSGWQKQMLPELTGRDISDMVFTDSLNGYATTAYLESNPGYILKTTNGGENWQITDSVVSLLNEIQFLNNNTGYICGADIFKTTNAGLEWIKVNIPFGRAANDMHVLNEDSIWFTDENSFDGGVYLTTNGGGSWTRKYYAGGSQNPDKIYFANSRLGFATRATNNYLRTSNGGETWEIIIGPFIWFNDMVFIDSLTGYKSNGFMMKTIDGGLSWIQQSLPNDTNFFNPDAVRFSKVKDTIWAVGANIFAPGKESSFQTRGILYFTSNGGLNWGYQIPDTSYGILRFLFIDFFNSKLGWAYSNVNSGIYTNSGGNDTTIYVSIKNISSAIPESFKLYQNYPNPFNPKTKIRYDILKRTDVKLKIFDINGRKIIELVNQEQSAGTYEAEFNGIEISSGIYFAVLNAGNFKDVIRMILVK